MITVIGMDGSPLGARAEAALAAATLVAGARRHLAATGVLVPAPTVADAAPATAGGRPEARAIVLGELGPALDALAAHQGDAVVLASGDPGFFGIVRALRERGLKFTVLPAVSSVALAFARAGQSWDDAVVVSAHGRDARPAVNVCRAHPKVAVLTGPGCGPAEIGAALAGWDRRLIVAEHLGDDAERVTECSPADAAARTWADPNVVLVLAPPVSMIMEIWPTGGPYLHDHPEAGRHGGPGSGASRLDGAGGAEGAGTGMGVGAGAGSGVGAGAGAHPGAGAHSGAGAVAGNGTDAGAGAGTSTGTDAGTGAGTGAGAGTGTGAGAGWLAGVYRAQGGWALSEDEFDSQDAVMTKAEVRALALARIAPGPGFLVWDVGAGSGSVGIECARFGAAVIAVERDPVRCERIQANARRHGVDVRVVPGAAPGALERLPDPDTVFVGGGGPGVIEAVAARHPARIVVALAAVERAGPAREALAAAGYVTGGALVQAARFAPLPGDVHRLAATNPVFLVWGTASGTTEPGKATEPGSPTARTMEPGSGTAQDSPGAGTTEPSSGTAQGTAGTGATGPVSGAHPGIPGTGATEPGSGTAQGSAGTGATGPVSGAHPGIPGTGSTGPGSGTAHDSAGAGTTEPVSGAGSVTPGAGVEPGALQ